MQYWSGNEVTLHVMDGSLEPIPEDKLLFFNNNIHYHHYPISIFDRFAKAIELIDTEYSVFQGDDEFFSSSALLSCINELERDSELVSCMGRCLLFDYQSNNIVGRPTYLEMKGYALMQNDPVDRMVAHMNPYTCSTVYSVMRTPVWKQAMSSITIAQFPVFSIEEYQVEMIASFLGKSKVIPVLYWFRSMENVRITQDGVRFNNWWVDKNELEQKEKFIDLMIHCLTGTSGMSSKQLRAAVIKTGDAFTKWSNEQGLGIRVKKSGFTDKIVASLKVRLPSGLKRIYKKIAGTLTLPLDKTMHPIAKAVKKLKADGVSVDESEVKQIEQIILDFYQDKIKTEKLVNV